MRFRSSNPVFSRINKMDNVGINYESATYRGVAGKSFYFTILIVLGAILGIGLFATKPDALMSALPIVGITTFITALIAMMSPRATKIAGTIYCISEGVLVGLVSLIFETVYPGVVIAGLTGTIAVLFVVGTVYFTGLVKVTGRFVKFLLIFAISVILCQFALFILTLFMPELNTIYSNFGVSLLVSGVMIFLATMYLMFDMENIRQVVEGGQPKEMEWYASFGLVFTIVWLYMEVLRLVAIIMDRVKN